MAERASKIDLSVDNIDDVLTAQINLASAADDMRLAYFLNAYSPSAAALHMNDAASDIEDALDALGLVAVPKAEADPLRDAAPELLTEASKVMALLDEHGADIVPHLLDTDDNPGQRLRAAIAKAKGGADV